MLKLVAKIFKLNPNGFDRGLFWIAFAITILFALWYVLVVTGQKGRPWYRVNFWGRFVTNDRKIIWAYIVALVAWPILAGIAIFPVIPLWVRMVAATLLVGLVLWEMYQGANRILEYIPLVVIIVFAIIIMYAIKNTMLEVIKATTGDPTYGQQLLCNWPRAALILVIAAIISSMLLTWTKAKGWWLPKLIALVVVVIMLAVQAWSLHEAKAEADKEKGDKGATLSVSPSAAPTATATVTSTQDPGNTINNVYVEANARFDFIMNQAGWVLGKTLPELSSRSFGVEDRLYAYAVATPFRDRNTEAMRKEFLEERLLNPDIAYAICLMLKYRQKDQTPYWVEDYILLYEKDVKNLSSFLADDGTLNETYFRYAVAFWELHQGTVDYEEGIETAAVVRAHRDLYEDIPNLEVVEGYKESQKWDDAISFAVYDKDDTVWYLWYDIYDVAPLVPKETPTPTPTPKPTLTPTPKPTSTPTPKPTSTPTPKPTATPTPKPTSTPTPKPTSTPTPKPTATPTPTYPPKDKTESSTGGKEENKPNPVNENFTGSEPTSTPTPTPKPTSTPTGTPKPTATPTPTPAKPRSSKDESSTSLNEDLNKANDQMAEANAETQISVAPKPAIVPDCDNPGQTKEVPGTVHYGDYPEVVGAPTLAEVVPETTEQDTSKSVPWGGSGY